MVIHTGKSPEDLIELENQVRFMVRDKAREYLRTNTNFTDKILNSWMDDIRKKYPESQFAMSYWYKDDFDLLSRKWS